MLFEKLEKMGFGGKTLQIIKSMYKNDSIRFLINGQYTLPVYLTKGVRQGIDKLGHRYIFFTVHHPFKPNPHMITLEISKFVKVYQK